MTKALWILLGVILVLIVCTSPVTATFCAHQSPDYLHDAVKTTVVAVSIFCGVLGAIVIMSAFKVWE